MIRRSGLPTPPHRCPILALPRRRDGLAPARVFSESALLLGTDTGGVAQIGPPEIVIRGGSVLLGVTVGVGMVYVEVLVAEALSLVPAHGAGIGAASGASLRVGTSLLLPPISGCWLRNGKGRKGGSAIIGPLVVRP